MLRQVNYRIDGTLADHFDRHCDERGKVRRRMAEEALREWLERQQDPAPSPANDAPPAPAGDGAGA